ncbi:MAG TPA: SDR family NAD(P)-dependent oxidoreductase [Nakamurella sp.]
MNERGTAVVTGASSGIGAATARRLAEAGFSVVLGARREDRVEALAADLGAPARAFVLDVTDGESVVAFCRAVGPECRLLVNNAGGALGLEPVAQADEAKWQAMFDSNVMGVLRMTQTLLPRLIESGDGHIITVGSVAGFEPYAGGAGYNAAKHAVRAVTDVLRIELVGQPVRVSEVDPGLVETEFSLVRFDGDQDRADAVYEGMTPLTAADVADVIAFVATRPSHVDIDQVVIRPRDQARVWLVHRDQG